MPCTWLQGAFTVPGTFSAAPLAAQLPTTTPVHPFGSTHATSLPPLAQQSATAPTWAPSPSLPALTPAVSALSFFYGHTEWGRNDGLTDALLTRLGDCVRRRVDENRDEGLWRGGMIIDTPADFAKKDKHAMITRCVREFEGEPAHRGGEIYTASCADSDTARQSTYCWSWATSACTSRWPSS